MTDKSKLPNNHDYETWQQISDDDKAVVKAKINLETSTVKWQEVERFFAQGKLILVDESCDLVETAWHIEEDHATEVKQMMDKQLLGQVETNSAKTFHKNQQDFWCVVVKPWVLIQILNP